MLIDDCEICNRFKPENIVESHTDGGHQHFILTTEKDNEFIITIPTHDERHGPIAAGVFARLGYMWLADREALGMVIIRRNHGHFYGKIILGEWDEEGLVDLTQDIDDGEIIQRSAGYQDESDNAGV